MKELVMDATFGTNSTGMSLFAVLAEVDGTGVPLAYYFMETFEGNSHGVRQAAPRATTAILYQFLRPLQASPCVVTGMYDELFALSSLLPIKLKASTNHQMPKHSFRPGNLLGLDANKSS